MNENGHKLHHLESGQVLLPPNVFLVFWSHSGNHIIKVHNNMHEPVLKRKQQKQQLTSLLYEKFTGQNKKNIFVNLRV